MSYNHGRIIRNCGALLLAIVLAWSLVGAPYVYALGYCHGYERCEGEASGATVQQLARGPYRADDAQADGKGLFGGGGEGSGPSEPGAYGFPVSEGSPGGGDSRFPGFELLPAFDEPLYCGGDIEPGFEGCLVSHLRSEAGEPEGCFGPASRFDARSGLYRWGDSGLSSGEFRIGSAVCSQALWARGIGVPAYTWIQSRWVTSKLGQKVSSKLAAGGLAATLIWCGNATAVALENAELAAIQQETRVIHAEVLSRTEAELSAMAAEYGIVLDEAGASALVDESAASLVMVGESAVMGASEMASGVKWTAEQFIGNCVGMLLAGEVPFVGDYIYSAFAGESLFEQLMSFADGLLPVELVSPLSQAAEDFARWGGYDIEGLRDSAHSYGDFSGGSAELDCFRIDNSELSNGLPEEMTVYFGEPVGKTRYYSVSSENAMTIADGMASRASLEGAGLGHLNSDNWAFCVVEKVRVGDVDGAPYYQDVVYPYWSLMAGDTFTLYVDGASGTYYVDPYDSRDSFVTLPHGSFSADLPKYDDDSVLLGSTGFKDFLNSSLYVNPNAPAFWYVVVYSGDFQGAAFSGGGDYLGEACFYSDVVDSFDGDYFFYLDSDTFSYGDVDASEFANNGSFIGLDAEFADDGSLLNPGHASLDDVLDYDGNAPSWGDVLQVGDVLPVNSALEDVTSASEVFEPSGTSGRTVSEAIASSGPSPGTVSADVSLDAAIDDISGKVSGKFPFCLPRDVLSIAQIFSSPRAAPHISWPVVTPLGSWDVDVDLKDFKPVAVVLRFMMDVLLLFLVIKLCARFYGLIGEMGSE